MLTSAIYSPAPGEGILSAPVLQKTGRNSGFHVVVTEVFLFHLTLILLFNEKARGVSVWEKIHCFFTLIFHVFAS